jgi:hypothetical protein
MSPSAFGVDVTAQGTVRELFEMLDGRVAFGRQPEAIPGDLRASWRLSILCVILMRCRGSKASLQTLHVLWWAMRSRSSRGLFVRWLEGDNRPDDLVVRFDPSLTVTLDLALGAALVTWDSGTSVVTLTAEGKSVAEAAWSDERVLREERAFLRKLPAHITQKSMRELLEWR